MKAPRVNREEESSQEGEITLDLPRDNLIGWIGTQLEAGVRGVELPRSRVGGLSDQVVAVRVRELFEKKRAIVGIAKLNSEVFTQCVSQQWRVIELKHAQFKAESRERRWRYALKCLEEGLFDLDGSGSVVAVTGTGFDEAVCMPGIEDIDSLGKAVEKTYTICRGELESASRRHAESGELMKASFKDVTEENSVSKRSALLLEEYLQERHLLAQRKKRRDELETELKEKVAALSAQIHTMRDVHRVKEGLNETRMQNANEAMDMQERQLEWRLMEEQIRLERELKEMDHKHHVRIARIQREIAHVSQIGHVESEFVRDKSAILDQFKQEVSNIRRDVRAIETAVSHYRTALRKSEREKREEAKQILRE